MTEPSYNFVMKHFSIRTEAFYLNSFLFGGGIFFFFFVFFFSSPGGMEIWPNKLLVLYRSACRNSIAKYSFMVLFDSVCLLMSLLKRFYCVWIKLLFFNFFRQKQELAPPHHTRLFRMRQLWWGMIFTHCWLFHNVINSFPPQLMKP